MATAHEITLMGRELRVRSDEDPAHVQAVAEYINSTIDKLSKGRSNVAPQHLLMMASMTIADELFKLRAEHERLTERIRSSSRSLLARLAGSGPDVAPRPTGSSDIGRAAPPQVAAAGG